MYKTLRDEMNKVEIRFVAGDLVSTHNCLIPKMEIYGFIPICEDDAVYSFMKNNCFFGYKAIAADKIVYDNFLSEKSEKERYIYYPIYKRVEKVLSNKTTILKQTYIPKFRNNPYYLKYVKETYFDNDTKKLANLPQVKVSDSNVYYTTTVSEYLFYRHVNIKDKIIAACADSFMVVCMYINPVSGKLEYQIFSPDDLIKLEK